MDDNYIVDLYLQREESAIACTRELYGSRLRALAESILGDVEAAKECENDTYLAVWNSIPPHEPRTYFYAYLARITRHVALDHCRKWERLKRKVALVEFTAEMEQCIPHTGPKPEDVVEQMAAEELGQVINGFLRKLPRQQCSVFLQRYWYLDSIETIAERYGMSRSKVKSMLFRIRKRLKRYLEKEGYTV